MDYAVNLYEFIAGRSSKNDPIRRQLRRAAVSVPSNIAEGTGSAAHAEFSRFPGEAYRSLKEIVTTLELCQRLCASPPPPHRSIDG